MATSKPQSTISYNTEAFLKEHLDDWVKGHLIQAYQYICHVGEDGDKDHIHVRIEPNKSFDVMNLSDALKEYVQGEKKPRGVRPWRPSKEEDWFMYVVHDPEYMRLKYGEGEKGEKLPYEWTAIVTPEDYDLQVAFLRAKSALSRSASNMAKRITEGEKPVNLVFEGRNPFAVNAVMNLVKTNDYTRLQDQYKALLEKYEALDDKFEKLLDAIDRAGCYIAVNPYTQLPELCRDPIEGVDDRLRTEEIDPFVADETIGGVCPF